MTTTIKNGQYAAEVHAFRSPALPSNPLPFLYAIHDRVKEDGPGWLKTDECKALLFPVLLMVYGSVFRIDSVAEFQRLDETISSS